MKKRGKVKPPDDISTKNYRRRQGYGRKTRKVVNNGLSFPFFPLSPHPHSCLRGRRDRKPLKRKKETTKKVQMFFSTSFWFLGQEMEFSFVWYLVCAVSFRFCVCHRHHCSPWWRSRCYVFRPWCYREDDLY